MRTPALVATLVLTGLLALACGDTAPAPAPEVLTVPQAPPDDVDDPSLEEDVSIEEMEAMAAAEAAAASANPGPFTDPGGSGILCCGESVGGDMFYSDPSGGKCADGLSWHRGKDTCSTVCCEFKSGSTSYATTLRANCVDSVGGTAKLAVALKCKGHSGSHSSPNKPRAGSSTNLNRGGSGGTTKVRGGSSSSGSGTTLRR